MSQLYFVTEENEASTAREVLGDLSGGSCVPSQQGQPYFHVCIHLHEDELLPASIHNASG